MIPLVKFLDIVGKKVSPPDIFRLPAPEKRLPERTIVSFSYPEQSVWEKTSSFPPANK